MRGEERKAVELALVTDFSFYLSSSKELQKFVLQVLQILTSSPFAVALSLYPAGHSGVVRMESVLLKQN